MDDISICMSSSLDPIQIWVLLWSTFGAWQVPYTHKVGSWSHHLVDDAEDPGDDAEDPGDGAKAPVDDVEALDGLEKH